MANGSLGSNRALRARGDQGLPKRVGSGPGDRLNERPVLEGAISLVNDVHGRETAVTGRQRIGRFDDMIMESCRSLSGERNDLFRFGTPIQVRPDSASRVAPALKVA